MTTPKIWDAKHPTGSRCPKNGWRCTSLYTGLWLKSSLLASTCLILAAAAPLTMAQDNDDYVAAPATDEIAEPAPAAAAAAPAAAAPAAVAAPAAAPTQDLGRMQVTGSAIARTDAETAVPVTIIEADEFKQQGITSTEDLVSQLSSNDTSEGPGLGTGSAYTGGASFANLRGIGSDKTLILLNGRRLANNSYDGSAVDLNSIPFGAIQRVEVLRDGASAIYGTDAIGGVINFITKKNLTGGEVEFGYDAPTHSGGGDSGDMSLTWGNGDLEKDGFNIMASANYNKIDDVDYVDRNNIREVYDPSRGIYAVSSFGYPANYYQGDVSGSPAAAGGCDGEGLVNTGGDTCSYDYGRYGQIQQETEKTSLYTNASVKLAENHTASLSYLWSHNSNTSLSAPSPTSSIPLLDPSSPFYPDNPALDPTQPVSVRWRGIPAGPRVTHNTIDAQRLLLTFDGDFSGFNYDTGFGWNQSETTIALRSGQLDDAVLTDAFNDGLIDPFSTGPLTDEGLAALRDAEVSGDAYVATNDVYSWDGKLSREIGDWFGAGSSAFAVGADYRYEKLQLDTDADITSRATSAGLSPDAAVSEHRDVKGIYGELNVPVIDGLEVTAAVRYDDYSDVGDTTNPKISFRWQPIQQLLVRGAYSEGFRAPSLYELYDPNYMTFSPSGLSDPQRCPGGGPTDCNTQFNVQQGGNADLEPEEAKNWTLGFVLQPFESFSAGLDFWWIEIENEVSAPSADYVLENDPGNVVRNEDGSIDYIVTTNQNLGTTKTNGVDVSANYLLPTSLGLFNVAYTGTYVDRYDYQQTPESSYESAVGRYSDGTIFRWKHRLALNWSKGHWGAGVINHYMSGYDDYDTETHSEVGSYTTWDALGAYTFSAGPRITLGVKNMFDRDPPFSNQPEVGQTGYDARYADALGRTVYARFNYAF